MHDVAPPSVPPSGVDKLSTSESFAPALGVTKVAVGHAIPASASTEPSIAPSSEPSVPPSFEASIEASPGVSDETVSLSPQPDKTPAVTTSPETHHDIAERRCIRSLLIKAIS